MMNLKNLGKRSYFKLAWHIFLVCVIVFGFIGMIQLLDINEAEYKSDRELVIQKYELKIKEKDSLNHELKMKQYELRRQVDSLENKKEQIVIEYGKKIKAIYDASATEHAQWMESIIAKLDSMKTE